MKKTRQEFEQVERLVQRAYNRRGRLLRERLDKPYDERSPELGYSWKTESPENSTVTYNVVVSKLGDGFEDTEYRIKIHEYGHIYLAHFEGIYEELDRGICNIFRDYRGQIIDTVNKSCGVDFGEKLIERVIDDPQLNHSLHNIAMDMEVNSKLLSDEDVEEMESDISKATGAMLTKRLEEYAAKIKDEKKLEKIRERIEKMQKEAKVKLILPCRYHTPDGEPFPDGLSYPEYLMLIVKNLDQFVKMLIDINNGGSGNTDNVTDDQIRDALKNGMQGLGDLMKAAGMSDEDGDGVATDQDGQGGEGLAAHDTSNSGGYKFDEELKYLERDGLRDDDFEEGMHKDHGTKSRDEADQKRELGEITAGGGAGCGSSGGTFATRDVSKTDEVDAAIDEAILDQKSRVIQFKTTRDVMKNWNLGRNRSVIAPSIDRKVMIDTNPKIVYLIDISGSMDTALIDRILNTIAKKMKGINKGLRYDIISWSTDLGDHMKDIDPKKGVPHISVGGGTRLGRGIKYFHDHYDENAILIIASDFEDCLNEWVEAMKTMKGYSIWGFNYGRSNYDVKWPKNFKLRNFNKSYLSNRW